ncbi:MAG: acetolactate synthase large subunit [Xanthomonadales bacterium]|nr:acetolactate synthase large subunit [Gammaproteobacteria bacterium]MBT8053223.1 acetolactate synthase large subunit [Gammaproteobacteria bacterium]NND57199.1 acetolactate synthase large subunit [Xanthomonadales bacterium]NNK50263.1 acetolactate synthase large subunit [Xanthomonadales bacterium]
MNGAEKLLETLVDAGVEVCFSNPGTSEMQLVSAIGNNDGMRAVLCLFEGVVSGAADGYGRMAEKPAITLLHVGSGFSNSMANLHNARRAHTPLVNIVGDHATYHLQYDSPLTSDVPAHAAICSDWVKVSLSADDLAESGGEAVMASLEGAGKIATLIAPANHAWEETTRDIEGNSPEAVAGAGETAVSEAVAALSNGKRSALLLGGKALLEESLAVAGQIARASGARVLSETFTARLQRGAGRFAVERLQYFSEHVTQQLEGLEQIILVGAQAPVSFFAYPGKKSWLVPEGCEVFELASVDQDIPAALAEVAGLLEAGEAPELTPLAPPFPPPTGALTPVAIGQTLTLLMPEDAIVSDEAATCGLGIFPATENARPHDWLMLTGGAIGQGLPLSLGASVACPERKVVALQADGSAMYTVQALWSMARENTDVTVVILNNRSYAILNIELARVGAGEPTPKTLSMLDLSRPDIDWVAVAEGLGLPASRAESAEEFHQQFADAMEGEGPCLIEAMVEQQMPI